MGVSPRVRRLALGLVGPFLVSGCVQKSGVGVSVPPGFHVYDAINLAGKPPLGAQGLRPLPVLYESALWPPGAPKDNPVESTIRAAARGVNAPDHILCVDIEYWPLQGVGDAQFNASLAKYRQVVGWIKQERPDLKVGFYGVLPVRDYWSPVGGEPAKLQDWQAKNAKMRPLADAVDVIFPSLYTFYPNPAQWATYAEANLRAARQYGKPVYAFLMPVYHESNRQMNSAPLPEDFWRQELQTVAKNADGAVIWTGPGGHWDEGAPWWRVARQFAAATH